MLVSSDICPLLDWPLCLSSNLIHAFALSKSYQIGYAKAKRELREQASEIDYKINYSPRSQLTPKAEESLAELVKMYRTRKF